MPSYSYTACDPRQQTIQGSLEAANRQAAARQLNARGLRPVRLHESGRGGKNDALPRAQPVETTTKNSSLFTARERLPFLKALTSLVASGYPMGEALRLLPRRLRNPKLAALSSALWERLRAGATLSRALEDFPATFDVQAINLIRAGEATGNVKEVLQRLIQHYLAAQQLRRRIITALCYPAFICLVATGVLLFFALFLMPRLQGLLTSLGGTLPTATKILVALSRGLVFYGPFLAIIAGLAGVGLWRWTRQGRGRTLFDALVLRLPVIGPLAIDICVQTFCQTLAILVENGIPTVEALRIAQRAVPNEILRQGLARVAEAVVDGQALGRALGLVPQLPVALIDRLNLAENTGRLAPHLRDLSEEMQEELTHRLKATTDVLSTAVLLFAFAFVGFVAYAIVSAVFQVSASFKY